MKKMTSIIFRSMIPVSAVLLLSGCSMLGNSSESVPDEVTVASESSADFGIDFDAPLEITYAKNFTINSNKDGDFLIKTNYKNNSQCILVMPEGVDAPEEMPDDYISMTQNPSNAEIDSQGFLSLLTNIDPSLLENVKLTALNKEDIQIPEVLERIEKDEIKIAGTLSSPDIDKMKEGNIDFLTALSSIKKDSMQKLQENNIPLMITYMQEENDPLARMEWAKVAGVIFDRRKQAEDFFNDQISKIDTIDKAAVKDKKITCFYLSQDKKTVAVKTAEDYLAKLCTLSGGQYFVHQKADSKEIKLPVGDFIEKYKEADALINLSEYGNEIDSVKALSDINDKFGEMNAVKNNNVWKTTKNHYQITNLGDLAVEINDVLATDDGGDVNPTNLLNLK